MNQTARRFSVCVYCGSRPGQAADHLTAARVLGRVIGQRGWRLVYGGGHVGLMGAVADATLAAGGEVLGVIPERLKALEVGHAGLSELRVVGTMHERKRIMAEQSDAFVALPGGIGTFEELFETWTWRHLGYHDQPIGLLNVAGFFDPLLAFLAHTRDEGFIDDAQQGMLTVESDGERLLDQLHAQAQQAVRPEDFRQV